MMNVVWGSYPFYVARKNLKLEGPNKNVIIKGLPSKKLWRKKCMEVRPTLVICNISKPVCLMYCSLFHRCKHPYAKQWRRHHHSGFQLQNTTSYFLQYILRGIILGLTSFNYISLNPKNPIS